MAVYGFEIWDYISMSVMVLLSTLIAFYHVFKAKKDKEKSTKEFLVSGKGIGFIPIVLSTVASALSPVSVQGFPYEIYAHGSMFAIFIITPYLSMFIFTHLILPVYYNLGISSVFEYLELRFCRTVRLMASLVSTSQMVLYTSCIIYSPALAISQVTGLHLWTSVLTIGIICVIYTSLGGIKAVIWADAVQFIIMLGATMIIVVKGFIDVGGVSEVFSHSYEGYRLNFFLSENEYTRDTVFTFVIGGVVLYLVFITPNQMFVQRLLSNSNVRLAKWSLFVSSIIMSLFLLVICLLGLIMYTKYKDCDPWTNKDITTGDQLVPYFALETLSFVKGLPGVFVSGILCAALSSLSSILNSLATVTLVDYITPFYPNMTESRTMILSKILAAAYGVLCIGLVSVVENLGGIIRAIFALSGAIGGPLLGVFIMGVFFPWTNSKGAIAGFVGSLSLCAWATVGNLMYSSLPPSLPVSVEGCNASLDTNMTLISPVSLININQSMQFPEVEPVLEYPLGGMFFLYEMSSMWYSAVALAATFAIGISFSIVTGVQNPEELPPGVISPAVESLISRLPVKYRLFLGYKSEKIGNSKRRKNRYNETENGEVTIPLDSTEEKNPADFI